jgi:putative transcriptional regulator
VVEILQNKNSATRLQILVEIAAGGPDIQQKKIAARLGITPQAVSDYVRQLADEAFVTSTGRSSYKVSARGVDWMLRMLRELQSYVSVVQNAVTNITVCAAIADSDISRGQQVGLKMKDGLLVATSHVNESARGIAVSGARKGEDVGISNIEGLVELKKEKIVILQVPDIQKGGSKRADLKLLRSYLKQSQRVAVIGIEAFAALRRTGVEPQYLYGVTEAIIEAARCGLSLTTACSDDAVPDLIKKLEEEQLDYELIDLTKRVK